MKNANSTAPGAAPYSARCGSHETRTAPHAARKADCSAPCGSHALFQTFITAPRADLKRFTKRSGFSSEVFPLLRFTASKLCSTTSTTRSIAEAGTAQICHWHFLALPHVAARTTPPGAISNRTWSGGSNQPAIGTVPLSGQFGSGRHSPGAID